MNPSKYIDVYARIRVPIKFEVEEGYGGSRVRVRVDATERPELAILSGNPFEENDSE